MRYLFVLLLAGCSYDAMLYPRGGGETLTGEYNRAGHSMTVNFKGDAYTGRVIQGQSIGLATSGAKSAAMVGASNQFSSVMVGRQGALRCEFVLGIGGNGLCQTPDGTSYDLVLK